MAEERSTLQTLVGGDGDEELPLIPPDAGCGGAEDTLLEFDADGSLVAPVPLDATERSGRLPGPALPIRPCPLTTLDGSWLLQIVPEGPLAFRQRPIRGPMRIDAGAERLRVSGDVYVGRPPVLEPAGTEPLIGPSALVIGRSWYPAFPQSEYRWYFRSTSCSYGGGVLTISFEWHLWSTTTQEFTSMDAGRMRLSCSRAPVALREVLAGRRSTSVPGQGLPGRRVMGRPS